MIWEARVSWEHVAGGPRLGKHWGRFLRDEILKSEAVWTREVEQAFQAKNPACRSWKWGRAGCFQGSECCRIERRLWRTKCSEIRTRPVYLHAVLRIFYFFPKGLRILAREWLKLGKKMILWKEEREKGCVWHVCVCMCLTGTLLKIKPYANLKGKGILYSVIQLQ